MPTERFARLPADKRDVILNAAIAEFSRVPFEKASINKIIQNADISRGSFYTYFEDKRDLLKCIFTDIVEKAQAFCQESLERNQGDFWKMLEEFLKDWFRLEWGENIRELIQIAVLQADMEEVMEKCGPGEMSPPESFERWIYEHGDWSGLRSKDYEFVHTTIALGIQSLMTTVGQMFRKPEEFEETYERFLMKLEILRNGACSPKAAEK